jgi:hypothetical protein
MPKTPRAIKSMIWFVVVPQAVFIVTITMLSYSNVHIPSSRFALLGLLPPINAGLGGLAWWHWIGWPLRAKVMRCRGAVCLRCTYDLSTLAETGVCPECGDPYSRSHVSQVWTRYRLYKP